MKQSKITLRKRILIAFLIIISMVTFLTFCWYKLPEGVFGWVVFGLFIVTGICDYFAKIYEKRKKEKEEQNKLET